MRVRERVRVRVCLSVCESFRCVYVPCVSVFVWVPHTRTPHQMPTDPHCRTHPHTRVRWPKWSDFAILTERQIVLASSPFSGVSIFIVPSTCVCTCARVCVCVFVSLSLSLCVCVCVSVCVQLHTQTDRQTRTHARTHARKHTHAHMHAYHYISSQCARACRSVHQGSFTINKLLH